jgi:hypothetical protein
MSEDFQKRIDKAVAAILYAKSCVKNRDSRECTTLWLDRAVQQLTSLDVPMGKESEFWE